MELAALRRVVVPVVLCIALVALAGCALEQGDDWAYGALVDVKRFSSESGERRLDYVVPGGETTTLRLRVELSAGNLAIALRDPSGRDAWAEIFEAPCDQLADGHIDGAPGDWTVVVDFDDGATGRYDLRIVSR